MKKFLLSSILVLAMSSLFAQLSLKEKLFTTDYFNGDDKIKYSEFKKIIRQDDKAAAEFSKYQNYHSLSVAMDVLSLAMLGTYLSDTKNNGYGYAAIGLSLTALFIDYSANDKRDAAIEIRNGAVSLSYRF